MEFDKSRVYTALNADELRAGDKVIVGGSLLELKTNVQENRRCGNIVEIGGECSNRRFTVDDVDGRGQTYWELAYLVKSNENCTNCKGEDYCKKKYHIENGEQLICNEYVPRENCTNCNKYHTCQKFTYETPSVAGMTSCSEYEPKTEPKTEKPKQKEREMGLQIMDYDKEKDKWYYRPIKECENPMKPNKDAKIWVDEALEMQKKESKMNWNYEGLPEKQEIGTSDRVLIAETGCTERMAEH